MASDPASTPEVTSGRTTSRGVRLAGIVLVLLVPFAWVTVALLQVPSDGTLVVASSSLRDSPHWSNERGVPVRDTYGSTDLAGWLRLAQEADTDLRVTSVDGRPLAEWGRDPSPEARIGDSRSYGVTAGEQSGEVEVVLRSYPLLAALRANPGALILWVGLAAAGAFVFWRRPRDAAARTLLALAALVPMGMTAFPLGLQVIDLAGGRGLWPYAVGEVANAFAWGSMLFFACVFPEPMPALRRRPWLGAVPFVVPFVLYAAWAAVWVPTRPRGLPREEALTLISAPSAVLVLPLIAGVLIARFRRTQTREHRLAIRVVLTSVLLALLLFVCFGALADLVLGVPVASLQLQPLFLAIPLAGIVAAVLRYRLYEVDLIIRRSLLLLAAAVVLSAVFLLLAALVSDHLPDDDVARLVVGGLLAVLLIPVARLLGQLLSRIVLGIRDDPYRVVSQLREIGPSTSIQEALTRALQTLADNLRLSYAAVEVDQTEEAGPEEEPFSVAIGTPHRRPTVVDIQSSSGRPWGRLVLGVAGGREPFGPRDARLLQDVAGQIGTLVESLVMNQALQQSRARIVTAREKERNRLHRDLHDGLGPELAMSSMHIDQARQLLHKDPARVDPLLARIAADTRDHINEVRRIVDDLRPQALDQFGLISALRERATSWSVLTPTHPAETNEPPRADASITGAGPGRPMLLAVEADEINIGQLPPAVEVAAYRIVLEAVNNAAKYSGADQCRVHLSRDNGHLRVVVTDNGSGLPHEPREGIGLGSMRDRAEELGGTFTVNSAGSQGTAVTALLPIESV